MRKFIAIFILTIIYSTITIGQTKPVIEIYLVNKVIYVDTVNHKTASFFRCSPSDLPKNPFITDQEILKYEVVKDTAKHLNEGQRFYLHLTAKGQQKLSKIGRSIPLDSGQRFVLTVNKQPVFGGYFWNLISSFGCAWITIPAVAANKIPIEKALPYDYFTQGHSDPREDNTLLDALKLTGRLLKH